MKQFPAGVSEKTYVSALEIRIDIRISISSIGWADRQLETLTQKTWPSPAIKNSGLFY